MSSAPLMTRCVDHLHANAPKRVNDRADRSGSEPDLGTLRARSLQATFGWSVGVATHDPTTPRPATACKLTHLPPPKRARRPEGHLTPREVWVREPTPPTTPKDDRRHHHAANRSRHGLSPTQLVVHELSDDAAVAGSTSRNPIGLGGESEVHDSEQAPSPLRIDRARDEH